MSPASTAAALLRTCTEHDGATGSHSDRVAELAVRVGAELGLSYGALSELALGAALHDVGKLALSERILRKPGPLNEEEQAAMREHPRTGGRIVAAHPELRAAASVVRSHHERFDGAGYPDGLAGPTIPLGARIVAVCDAYCAMRERRPYRPARSKAQAIAELRAHAGRQFDPRVVGALVAAVRREQRDAA